MNKYLFRGLRIYLGLSQKELAELLGISSQSVISTIENERRSISKNLLKNAMRVIEEHKLNQTKLIELGKRKKEEWIKIIKNLSRKFTCSNKHSRARLASTLDCPLLNLNWTLGRSKYKVLPAKILSRVVKIQEETKNIDFDSRKLLFFANKMRILKNFPKEVLLRHLIKCLRFELKLTPEQIATKLKMNKDFYKRWELGYQESTQEAKILNVFDKKLQEKILNQIRLKKISINPGILELWQWYSTNPDDFEGIIDFRVDPPYYDGFDFHWKIFKIIKSKFDNAIFGPIFASKDFKFEKGVDVVFRYKGKLIGVEIKDYHRLTHHRLGVVLSWKIGELKMLKSFFNIIILMVNNKLTPYVKRKFQENGIILIDNTEKLMQALRKGSKSETYKSSFSLSKITRPKNRHKLGEKFEEKVYRLFKRKGYGQILRKIRIENMYFPRGKEIDLYIPKEGVAISCKSGKLDEKTLRNELLNLEMLSREIPEVKKIILAIDHKVSSHMKSISNVEILEVT